MNPMLIRAILMVLSALLGGGGLFQAGQASEIFSGAESVGAREVFAISWPFAGAGLAAILAILCGRLDGTPKEVAEAARDWLAHSKERSPASLRRAILSTCDVVVAAAADRYPKVAAAVAVLVNAVIEELGPTIVTKITRETK